MTDATYIIQHLAEYVERSVLEDDRDGFWNYAIGRISVDPDYCWSPSFPGWGDWYRAYCVEVNR
jgi:hypothetical protein